MPKAQLTGHQWRQFGMKLVCQSCPNEHGLFLPPHIKYTGLNEDGTPNLSVATRSVVPPLQDGLEQSAHAPASSSASDD